MLLVIEDVWTASGCSGLTGWRHRCPLPADHLHLPAGLSLDQEAIIVPELKEADGLALLARFVPELVEQDLQGAHALVQAVGSLPLALTLIGKYLAFQTFTDQSWPLQTAWPCYVTPSSAYV